MVAIDRITMNEDFPDRCIQYLEGRGLVLTGPSDHSDFLFKNQLYCYSIETELNGKSLLGIGTGKDDFTAASKCLSELLERILIQDCIDKHNIIFGSAFHPDLMTAQECSLSELLERATLSALSSSNCSRARICKTACPKTEFFDYHSAYFNINCFLVEYFLGKPVVVVELNNGKCLANGFALLSDNYNVEFEKAYWEAFRRLKVFSATSKKSVKSLEQFSENFVIARDHDSFFENSDSFRIVNKTIDIKGLGFLSLHCFEDLQAVIGDFNVAQHEELLLKQ